MYAIIYNTWFNGLLCLATCTNLGLDAVRQGSGLVEGSDGTSSHHHLGNLEFLSDNTVNGMVKLAIIIA